MNKTIVMKRRRIGIMLSSLDDDGIMIEMMTENVRRKDIILYNRSAVMMTIKIWIATGRNWIGCGEDRIIIYIYYR